MANRERLERLAASWALALAFGWIEAAVVVYLREIAARELGSPLESPLPLISSLPRGVIAVEIAREACTLLLLGAAAWLAGRRWAERAGAFLLMFGVWDLVYYGGLRLVLGWPESLASWDVLFLIPAPWVAPVWAPMTVAFGFAVAGSYLFWTAERPRHYTAADAAILLVSAVAIVAAFLLEAGAVLDQRTPRFPAGLFAIGVLWGTLWFAHVELRGTLRPMREVKSGHA